MTMFDYGYGMTAAPAWDAWPEPSAAWGAPDPWGAVVMNDYDQGGYYGDQQQQQQAPPVVVGGGYGGYGDQGYGGYNDQYNGDYYGGGYDQQRYNSRDYERGGGGHRQHRGSDQRGYDGRDYDNYDTAPRRSSSRDAARLTEGNLKKLSDRPRRRSEDERSTGSRRSSVGSAWRGINSSGAHSRYRRRNGQTTKLEQGEVAKPTGKRMALIVAINPEKSACATNSARHMKNFLKRYQFTVEEAFYTGDNEQFEADVQSGIDELCSIAAAGDSVFLHCIGYGVFENQNCTQLLQSLVGGLPEGTKVTCVLDCCYLASRPAFRIDHRSAKKGQKRFAIAMGPSQPCRPAVFCYMGEADHGDIAQFRSRDGQSCVYTTAWILSFNNKDIKGYWNEPPTYANLSWGVEYELEKIQKQQPKRNYAAVTNMASCSERYDIDQPCFL